jgi:hypothetical protein
MNPKQDVITSTWTGADGKQWRERRVWVGNGFRYFAEREIRPGVWLGW